MYTIYDSLKTELPAKNTVDTLEAAIDYCQKLILGYRTEHGIAQLPKITVPLNLLKETVEDDVEQLRLSEDPDARVGHKSAGSSFFGYKTHIAMREVERIITAAIVTTGHRVAPRFAQAAIGRSPNPSQVIC